MNERIRLLIESLGLTQAEFAEKVGIQPSTLSNALRGRNDVSSTIIIKIHETYPEISINWLMFGEGESNIESVAGAKPRENLIFSSDSSNLSEYGRDLELKNEAESFVKGNADVLERVTQIREDDRRVVRIMVFYSDNTFESFSSDQYKTAGKLS